MKLETYRPTRKLAMVFLALLIANVSCNRAAENSANGNVSNPNSSVPADSTSSTPPFPTKEPERYQATWVTSRSGGPEAGSIPGSSLLTNQQIPTARDGEKRRIETELLPGVKIIYLQLSSGRYVLYPAKKIYAEVKMDESTSMNPTQGLPSDFSPDKLMSGTPAGAKYEKLGNEEINGRMTTKYRVTAGGADASKTASETTIWADESLGMLIKMESTSKDGAKFSVEMRDIKLEVDPALFLLPKDYRKVEHSELLSSALPSVDEVLGIGDKNK